MQNDYFTQIINSSYYFLSFMYSGGYVLWAIFFINLILWTMILERNWYFKRVFPVMEKHTVKKWTRRQEHHSWYAQSIRAMMIASLQAKLNKHLISIRSFVELLPILGLLGTIIGGNDLLSDNCFNNFSRCGY